MKFSAKTIEDAVKRGLEELNLTKETAEITVITEPVKGIFGRVKVMAEVEITAKEIESSADIDCAKESACECACEKEMEMLDKILSLLGVSAQLDKTQNGEKEIIDIKTEDSSFIIGYRGEVLDALQTIAGAAANIGRKEYKKVVVDCENYRSRREDTLVKLAHRLEEKATSIRREVILEPMCAYDRRIIHTALAESTTVTTRSDGKEPERYVVIVPNDKDEFSKPYNAGRNNEKRADKKGGKVNKGGYGKRTDKKRSGFTESKRVAPSGFGTYLGNSLKDNK